MTIGLWLLTAAGILVLLAFAAECTLSLYDWFFSKKMLVVAAILALSGTASAGHYTPPPAKLPRVIVEGVPPVGAPVVRQPGFTYRQQAILVYAAGFLCESMGKATSPQSLGGSFQASFLRQFGVQLQAAAFTELNPDMNPGEAALQGFLIGL